MLDVLLQERRDSDTAERFFHKVLGHEGEDTTDKLGGYAAAVRHLPQLACVEHLQVRAV
jgi:transposase-like protein